MVTLLCNSSAFLTKEENNSSHVVYISLLFKISCLLMPIFTFFGNGDPPGTGCCGLEALPYVRRDTPLRNVYIWWRVLSCQKVVLYFVIFEVSFVQEYSTFLTTIPQKKKKLAPLKKVAISTLNTRVIGSILQLVSTVLQFFSWLQYSIYVRWIDLSLVTILYYCITTVQYCALY